MRQRFHDSREAASHQPAPTGVLAQPPSRLGGKVGKPSAFAPEQAKFRNDPINLGAPRPPALTTRRQKLETTSLRRWDSCPPHQVSYSLTTLRGVSCVRGCYCGECRGPTECPKLSSH